MEDVNSAVLGFHFRQEEEYINFVGENLDEPFPHTGGDVLRTDLMNHPVYIVQDILGRHRSFMNAYPNDRKHGPRCSVRNAVVHSE